MDNNIDWLIVNKSIEIYTKVLKKCNGDKSLKGFVFDKLCLLESYKKTFSNKDNSLPTNIDYIFGSIDQIVKSGDPFRSLVLPIFLNNVGILNIKELLGLFEKGQTKDDILFFYNQTKDIINNKCYIDPQWV